MPKSNIRIAFEIQIVATYELEFTRDWMKFRIGNTYHKKQFF